MDFLPDNFGAAEPENDHVPKYVKFIPVKGAFSDILASSSRTKIRISGQTLDSYGFL